MGSTKSLRMLEKCRNAKHGKIIIGGDFNAHNKKWSRGEKNKRGKKINTLIGRLDLMITQSKEDST